MIRSYNTIKKERPGWDSYQLLSYALIYTCIETLQRQLKFNYKEVKTKDGKLKVYFTDYFNKSIDYAIAFNFLQSNMFESCCKLCELDAYTIRDKIEDNIDIELVQAGEEALAREEKIIKQLNLNNKIIDIPMPAKWFK